MKKQLKAKSFRLIQEERISKDKAVWLSDALSILTKLEKENEKLKQMIGELELVCLYEALIK